MTAPYKVDMVTESVISHMAARIAALVAENAELKTRINDLATDWQVLHQQLETAREALVAARYMIYYEDAPLGWNLTRLGEVITAIGDAQPVSAEVKPIPKAASVSPDWFQCPTTEAWFEHPADADLLEGFVDPLEAGQEFELNVCWSGKQKFRVTKVEDDDSDDIEVELIKSSRQLFEIPAQQPRQESEIAAEALEEAAEYFEKQHPWMSNVSASRILRSHAAQKREAGK